jgi:hypothetical protein
VGDYKDHRKDFAPQNWLSVPGKVGAPRSCPDGVGVHSNSTVALRSECPICHFSTQVWCCQTNFLVLVSGKDKCSSLILLGTAFRTFLISSSMIEILVKATFTEY